MLSRILDQISPPLCWVILRWVGRISFAYAATHPSDSDRTASHWKLTWIQRCWAPPEQNRMEWQRMKMMAVLLRFWRKFGWSSWWGVCFSFSCSSLSLSFTQGENPTGRRTIFQVSDYRRTDSDKNYKTVQNAFPRLALLHSNNLFLQLNVTNFIHQHSSHHTLDHAFYPAWTNLIKINMWITTFIVLF